MEINHKGEMDDLNYQLKSAQDSSKQCVTDILENKEQ